MKTIKRKNFNKVIDNIKEQFWNDEKEGQDVWLESINDMLDGLLGEDFFGTDGQQDPRGDQRDEF